MTLVAVRVNDEAMGIGEEGGLNMAGGCVTEGKRAAAANVQLYRVNFQFAEILPSSPAVG